MISDAVSAVTQVVFSICLCALVSKWVPNSAETARDMSVLVSYMLIPSLTFYNIAVPLSVELLKKCSVLILFAVILVMSGVLIAKIAAIFLFSVKNTGIPRELRRSVRFELLRRRPGGEEKEGVHHRATHVLNIVVSPDLGDQYLEPKELLRHLGPPEKEYENQPFYCCALVLALFAQNAVTIPLSLLQALAETLPWIDLEAGTAYIFMYSIVIICTVWGVGPVLVRQARETTENRRMIREIMEQQCKLQKCEEVATQTEIFFATSRIASPVLPVAPDPQRSGTEKRGSVEGKEPDCKAEGTPETATCVSREVCGQTDDVAEGPWITLAETPGVCQTFACDLLETGQIRVISVSDLTREEAEANGDTSRLCSCVTWLKNTVNQLLRTPSFTSVLLGIFVGIISPIKNLFVGGTLSPVMDILQALAKGSIPCSLFLLGANFMNPKSVSSAPPPVRMRDAEQNTDFPLDDITVNASFAEAYNKSHQDITFGVHSSFVAGCLPEECVRAADVGELEGPSSSAAVGAMTPDSPKGMLGTLHVMFSLNGIRKNFMIGVIILRLIVMPAAGFALVVGLWHVVPSFFGDGKSQNVLLLVLLGQLASPSAINCNILFVSEQYMPHVWAKMLLYQYMCCVVTLTGWYALSIYIVT